MRTFDHPNMDGFEKNPCPICKSSKDEPVVLVPIPGTENGGNMEARQTHKECWDVFCKMNNIES